MRSWWLMIGTTLVAAASCAHSCGQSKTDFTFHEPCTNFALGAACAGAMGTICEVKQHIDPACNEWRVCTGSGSTWKTRPPDKTSCPTACPATFTEQPDASAEGLAPLCEYPEGTCGTAMDGGTPGKWHCAKTTAARGTVDQCPATRPAVGTPGCPANLICEYGWCKVRDAVRLQCQENQWVLMEAVFLAGDVVEHSPCE